MRISNCDEMIDKVSYNVIFELFYIHRGKYPTHNKVLWDKLILAHYTKTYTDDEQKETKQHTA